MNADCVTPGNLFAGTHGAFQRHQHRRAARERKDNSGEMAGAVFKAKGKIPLAANFMADAASGQLRITFTNFDGFETGNKGMCRRNGGRALFDEVGRYLMRDPAHLLREALPGNYQASSRPRCTNLDRQAPLEATQTQTRIRCQPQQTDDHDKTRMKRVKFNTNLRNETSHRPTNASKSG